LFCSYLIIAEFLLLPPSLSLSGCRREDFDASLIARSRPGQALNLHSLPYSAVALL
jgi:hypothetical protein